MLQAVVDNENASQVWGMGVTEFIRKWGWGLPNLYVNRICAWEQIALEFVLRWNEKAHCNSQITNKQSRIKSSLPIPLICTAARWTPATCGSYQGN